MHGCNYWPRANTRELGAGGIMLHFVMNFARPGCTCDHCLLLRPPTHVLGSFTITYFRGDGWAVVTSWYISEWLTNWLICFDSCLFAVDLIEDSVSHADSPLHLWMVVINCPHHYKSETREFGIVERLIQLGSALEQVYQLRSGLLSWTIINGCSCRWIRLPSPAWGHQYVYTVSIESIKMKYFWHSRWLAPYRDLGDGILVIAGCTRPD